MFVHNYRQNKKLWVGGVGDIQVFLIVNDKVSSLRLENVLYIPNLSINLISISQVTAHKVAIVHIKDKCKLISNYKMISTTYNDRHQEQQPLEVNITTQVASSAAHVVQKTDDFVVITVASRTNTTLQKWHE